MAKKTNKTDHVLNLLSSGNESTSGSESTKPQPPVEPGKVASVSVVQPSVEKEKLADTIRHSLEEELEKMEESGQVEEAREKVIEKPAEKVVEEATEKPEMAMEITEDVTEKAEAVQETKAEDTKIVDIQTEDTKEVVHEEQKSKTEKEKPEPEEDFAFVNVMERLVRDKAPEYMEQFGICMCPRCIEDTAALALTHLPPKYVVVNKAAISPLMNFYTQKFAGQITVEITKACIQVGDSPHH